jgi:hypothetical protein
VCRWRKSPVTWLQYAAWARVAAAAAGGGAAAAHGVLRRAVAALTGDALETVRTLAPLPSWN